MAQSSHSRELLSRMWKRSWKVCVVALCVACGTGTLETSKAPSPASSSVRNAASLTAGDLPLPEPTDRGKTGGIVALRLPAQRADVEPVLAQYFRAISREDLTGLSELLVRGAQSGTGASLVDAWRSRFQMLVYQRMSGRDVAIFPEMTIRSFGVGRETTPGAEGDLVVTVPLESSAIAGDPLFGPSATYVLRYEGRALKIVYAADEAPK